MFEQDYLVRMLMQLVRGIMRNLELIKDDDPKAAAELLEASIGEATELDGSVLLSLSPDSIADILQVSGTDPGVIEFVSRSLLLAASYLQEAGEAQAAQLRYDQGMALAQAYGIDVTADQDAFQAFEGYAETFNQ